MERLVLQQPVRNDVATGRFADRIVMNQLWHQMQMGKITMLSVADRT